MDSTLTSLLNGSHSLYLDGVAWLATQTLTWVPFILSLLYVLFRAHHLKEFTFLLLALALSILICDQTSSALFKPLIARYRPSQNPYTMHLVDIVNGYRGGTYGFFSSHAANTAAISTFSILLFRHRWITWSFLTWTLLNCWTRLYLGVHYLGDIVIGLLLGIVVGATFYYLYRAYISTAPSHLYPTRLLKTIPFIFLLTLCLIAIPWTHYF